MTARLDDLKPDALLTVLVDRNAVSILYRNME
jgi:hypothetical protein